MAKAVALLSAMCMVAVAAVSADNPKDSVINVEGSVYCDPCRVQFVTALSRPVKGAVVRLECKDIETQKVTYSVEGRTNEEGKYVIGAKGEHEENEICEVKPVNNPDPGCPEQMNDVLDTKLTVTDNNGIHTKVRYASPLGFMTKDVEHKCVELIQEFFKEDQE